jgi:hypothetical protein
MVKKEWYMWPIGGRKTSEKPQYRRSALWDACVACRSKKFRSTDLGTNATRNMKTTSEMSHQMKQTNRIGLLNHEDIYVRHLRSRLPHHMIRYPQVIDLGFLKFRPLRGPITSYCWVSFPYFSIYFQVLPLIGQLIYYCQHLRMLIKQLKYLKMKINHC